MMIFFIRILITDRILLCDHKLIVLHSKNVWEKKSLLQKNVDISAGLKWLIYKHFYYLQEVRKKVHYFVNTSITATCMFVEVSHALQVC